MDNFELRLENCSLQTKVQMQEAQIEMLMNQLSRFDENLKLSIQTPTMQTKCVTQTNRFSPTCKLYETVKKNLDVIDAQKLQSLLEGSSPSYPAVIHIFKMALQGEFSAGQIIKVSTNSMCEYLNEKGVVEMESTSTVFDEICGLVYQTCSKVFVSMNRSLEEEDNFDESSNDKLSNVYNNLMLLNEPKGRQKILKDISPILK